VRRGGEGGRAADRAARRRAAASRRILTQRQPKGMRPRGGCQLAKCKQLPAPCAWPDPAGTGPALAANMRLLAQPDNKRRAIARLGRLEIHPAFIDVQRTARTYGQSAVIGASERSAGGERHDEERKASDEHELDDGRDAGHDGRGNAA